MGKLSGKLFFRSSHIQYRTLRLISRAYSFYLERRLRAILQSIPQHLFRILHDTVIPVLRKKWPQYLDKKEARYFFEEIHYFFFKLQVKELANFEENFKLSEAAFTISNMSVGISRMTLKKLGTIEVTPRVFAKNLRNSLKPLFQELLEAGIRRELAVELPKTLAVNPKWNNLSGKFSSRESRRRNRL